MISVKIINESYISIRNIKVLLPTLQDRLLTDVYTGPKCENYFRQLIKNVLNRSVYTTYQSPKIKSQKR